MRTCRRLSSFVSGACLLAVLTAYGSSARACPSVCFHPLRLFSSGASIPGNLVYFKVFVDRPIELSLKTADGTVIPASIRTIGNDRVFAPDEPIPPDTLVVLTYPSHACGGDADKIDFAFRTRESQEIALQAGRVVPREYGVVSPGSLTFTSNVNSLAFQRFSFDGSYDTTGAARHLTDFEVSVDGQPAPIIATSWDSALELHAVCEAHGAVPQPIGTCHETILGPGQHVVSIQPHVVGFADPLPAQLDIDFDDACGLGRADPKPTAAAGAGTPQNQPQAGASAASETSPPRRITIPSTQSAADGGCSTTGRRDSAGAAWLALLALSFLRRKKSARAR